MTTKDMWEVIGLLVLLGAQLVNIRISMALRERDREDFELLRTEYEQLRERHHSLGERVAKIEGRI